jgi:RNA polymerase sigma-70 factor (ECF subfamily)
MASLPAEELVSEAQAYSQEAWAQIYDDYYAKIYEYCYLRTGDRAASEDLAADVFLEALRGIRRYRYRGVPLSAWLYKIARNLTADHLQRKKRRPTVPLGNEPDNPRLSSPDRSDERAVWQDVLHAIRELTEDQQQVILLRFFHGLSHDEVAAAMDRKPGAVRVLQNRALTALRRIVAA